MGFFDTLGAPASAATVAPQAPTPMPPQAAPHSFFDVLGAPPASAAQAVRRLKPAARKTSLRVPQDFGDTLGTGFVHGLGEGWDQIMRLGREGSHLTGFGSFARAVEPQAMQSAFSNLAHAVTVDPAHLSTPTGVGGAIGNFAGKAAPGTLAALATDGVTEAPEAAGLLERLASGVPANALMGLLWPSSHPEVNAAIAGATGPLVGEGLTAAAHGVGAVGDMVGPFIRRAAQSLRAPTEQAAQDVATNYVRSAATDADAAAVRAFHEAVPGVVHPPSVIANSDPMARQLAALRTRAPDAVDSQFNGNLRAIHGYLDEKVPLVGSARPVADTSADMLAHLMQAKSAARDAAAADRVPLDAVKPHVHVALDGMKKAYDTVADSLGTHTQALLPDWLRQTFEAMPAGSKTSYQNAESMIARLNAESAKAPADTTTNAILAKMRGAMKDALFNTTKFYDESGARLPAEYEGAVKDAQALANKSWASYRSRFPNDGKTPARQFIRGATGGKINASEFANGVFRNPELFDAWKNAVSHPIQSAAHDIVNNASGESAASAEAVSRHASEQAAGRYRYGINNDGSIIPIHGVEAADTPAAHGQIIVQSTGDPEKSYMLLDHGKGIAPGRARQIMANAEDQLKALDAQGGIPDDEGEAPRAKPRGTPAYDIRGARDVIRARMDALDAPREPDPDAIQLGREHYARQLQDHAFDRRGLTLDQTPVINGNKMRDFRSDKPNGHAWAEKQLFTPDESTALDHAQEAQIRNLKRYASIAKGQSPTEFLRQANKQAEIHPGWHVAAGLSGHGIAPVALTKGFELLSNRYASRLNPMVDEQLEHVLTDPSAFLDAMGRDVPKPRPSMLQQLKGNTTRNATRNAGHAAALLSVLARR